MGVLVVGMGRSGTSALTGALEAMGLSTGQPGGLMVADRGNPVGYFEQYTVADLNDLILAHLGGAWDCPPRLNIGWSSDPVMANFVAQVSELVDSCFEGQKFVVKDPRIAVLLPVWRRALLDRFHVVMIVRDPVEVAWSLHLRDGLHLLTGLALWSAYNRAALTGLNGLPVHVCAYEGLVTAPTETLGEVAASLQRWGELSEQVDIEFACARVRPGLRRDTWPRSQPELVVLPDEITALQKRLAERMGRHERFDSEETPIGWWEEPLLDERRGAAVLRRQLHLQNQSLVAVRSHLEEVEGRLVESGHLQIEFEQRIHDTEAALHAVIAEREDIRPRLEQTASALEAVTAERDDARSQLALWRTRWERLERRVPVRLYRAARHGFRLGRRRAPGTTRRRQVKETGSTLGSPSGLVRFFPLVIGLIAAAIDAALPQVLTPLMTLAPLTAGWTARPRSVALIGIASAAMTVPLGLIDHISGTAEQAWIVLAIVLAGLFGMGISDRRFGRAMS